MLTPELRERTFHDVYEDIVYKFYSDAMQSTIDSIPEVDWIVVKQVLRNFGYTVIEIDTGNCN